MGAPSSDKAGIRQVIRALRNAGYVLDSVYDGEDEPNVSNENEAIEAITAVDSATLWVKNSEGKRYGIFFVLGNSPEEVVCDYHVSLSHVIDPLTESWWN